MEYKRIFSSDEIKSILTELAAEYNKTSGEPLTVLIVGGSAAIFQFDKKNTKDIDIILTKASPIFNECKQLTLPTAKAGGIPNSTTVAPRLRLT